MRFVYAARLVQLARRRRRRRGATRRLKASPGWRERSCNSVSDVRNVNIARKSVQRYYIFITSVAIAEPENVFHERIRFRRSLPPPSGTNYYYIDVRVVLVRLCRKRQKTLLNVFMPRSKRGNIGILIEYEKRGRKKNGRQKYFFFCSLEAFLVTNEDKTLRGPAAVKYGR